MALRGNPGGCLTLKQGQGTEQEHIGPTLEEIMGEVGQRKLLTFKLPGQEVAQPSLQQRGDATHEKQPDPPASSPEATARALPYRAL